MTTTKKLWDKSKSAARWRAKPIINPSGLKIACLSGCGHRVSVKIMICRTCRRKAKIVQGRREERRRKQSKAGTR